MKNIIFIGKTGCGKTTLCQKLHNMALTYKKTQAVDMFQKAIDTPGEYLENKNFFSALFVTSVEAARIALVEDATSDKTLFPPHFASRFAKEVIGVVTKCAIAAPDQVEKARARLALAGAKKVFCVDTLSGDGIGQLFAYIEPKNQN